MAIDFETTTLEDLRGWAGTPSRPRPMSVSLVNTQGEGLLSGSFPLSMLTNEGNLPSHAEIRILYRPKQGLNSDGHVVATTTCNADGTWQVSGLNENLKFDIVARIPGFNDVIISDVQPSGAPLSAHFANLKEEYEYEEEVNIQIVALGGKPPYTYEAITLPDGLSLSSDGYITGTMPGVLELTLEVKIIDAGEAVFNLVGNSYVAGDPHWDKVVSLLHFDGNLNDEAGGEWAGEGYEFEDSGTPFGLMLKTDFLAYVESQFDITLTDSEPYTLEFFLKKQTTTTTATPVALYESSSNRLGVYFNNQTHVRVWYNSNIITVPVDMYELHHYALVGMGNGQIRLYVDGIWDGLVISKAHDVTGKLYLGRSGHGEPYGGLIGELRVTKGIARYTENFTPPTKPFLNF